MVDIHGSEICRQRIAERGRAIEVQLRGIVVAIAGRCVDADVVARVLRYDVDQTTSGVAAIQRALRAFENLNSLDIVEREGGGGGIRKIKAVKIGRDGQFGRIASAVRSEEQSSVGKEFVSMFRSCLSRFHKKKKKH